MYGNSDEVYACCGKGVMVGEIRTANSNKIVEECCNGKPYKIEEETCCGGVIYPGAGRCTSQNTVCDEGIIACGDQCCTKGFHCCGGSCFDPSRYTCQHW
jgi:hypothetical protein